MKTLIMVVFLFMPSLLWASENTEDICTKTCVIDSECGVGGVCDQGKCHYKKSFCFNERWSVNDRGESWNCDAYRCDSDTGLCLRKAKDSTDCLTGYVFNEQNSCIRSIQCNSADTNCSELLEKWQSVRNEYEQSTPEPVVAPLSCVGCENSQTCGTGQMCWQNRCVPANPHCQVDSNGQHFQVDLLSSKACGNYACEKVQGACLRTCLKESDCRSGRKCKQGLCQ